MKIVFACCLFLASCTVHVGSFHPGNFLFTNNRGAVQSFGITARTGHKEVAPWSNDRSKDALRSSTNDDDVDENKKNTATLRLTGRTKVASNKFLVEDTPFEDVVRFFERPEHRDIMLTAGGKRACEEIDLPADTVEGKRLRDAWRRACVDVGATPPDDDDDNRDTVLKVRTGGFRLPGLTLVSTAKIGARLVEDAENESLRYEFVLVGDERSVSGAPPIVWIYERLTGGGGNNNDNDSSTTTTTRSLTTTSYRKVDEGASFVFETDGYLSVNVEFPSFLLRILPGDKAKAEERGGQAFQKLLDGDVTPAMKAFEKAFVTWIKQK